MISVIMLTYNREKYIARAIEAILKQTYSDFEFVIVDNGSSDRSGQIADEYARKDARIKVLHIDKSTIGHGRNIGIANAKGDYIAFVDDEDVASPDMLGFLNQLVKDNHADIAICGAQKDVNGKILPHSMWNEYCIWSATDAVTELLKRKRNNAGLPTKLIKRTLFEQIPFKEDCKYEDIWICYKYMANANKVAAYGLPKYCFTRHENNNSSFTQNSGLWKAEQMEEYLAAFRERTEYISSKLPALAELVQYSEWSYMISMCDKIKTYELKDCYNIFVELVQELKTNQQEFLVSPYIQDFEKEWMQKYILQEG